MWVHWNGILHNLEHAKNDILAQGVKKISWIYDTCLQTLLREALLQEPKESILKLPLVVKQQWIELVQVEMDQTMHHGYGQYLSKQRFMATWVIYC